MQIKIFTIPVGDSGAAQEEMNRFLRANKILEAQNQLIGNESSAQKKALHTDDADRADFRGFFIRKIFSLILTAIRANIFLNTAVKIIRRR